MFIGILLMLVSCVPDDLPDEIVQNSDEEMDEGEISIVPSYKLSEENYKIILPFRPSEARGVITRQVANRLDIDEMEAGLRRHSTEVFDPEKYYFDEGQYLSGDTVYNWLERRLTEEQLEAEVDKQITQRKNDGLSVNDDVVAQIRRNLQLGLNPPLKSLKDADTEEIKEAHEDSPRYVSHILEQNFLQRVDDDQSAELVGVSIGIAMKSVYRYQTEVGGPNYYHTISNKEMLAEGKEIAQTILERLRNMEDLQSVPIMIALYREEEQSSPVPGNFVAKTVVQASDMLIGDWEEIDEEYVLFPSEYARSNYSDTHEVLRTFGGKISQYFPNYVGYIGEGFYIDGNLEKLTIEVPIEFHGSSEVLGFTQYMYGIIKNLFTGNYDLEVKITSSNKLESIIYKEANDDEPTVHILH